MILILRTKPPISKSDDTVSDYGPKSAFERNVE